MKSTRLARDSIDRRRFLIGSGVLMAGALTGAARKAWTAQLSADPALIEDVVAANRILAALEIVDGYGHVSARHDKDPNRYLIARSIAPELVTANDILELDLDSAPVFDIREIAGDTDMLVRTPELGAALARTLAGKPAALMRGHGAVVVGDSVAQAVGRSYYLQMDAKLQAQAAALGGDIRYLDEGEASKAESFGGYERSWELWKRKAMGK